MSRLTPQCNICSGGHWQRFCPKNSVNLLAKKLTTLKESRQIDSWITSDGGIEVTWVCDCNTRIITNNVVRNLLKEAGFKWSKAHKVWYLLRCTRDACVLSALKLGLVIMTTNDKSGKECRRIVGDGMCSPFDLEKILEADGFNWDKNHETTPEQFLSKISPSSLLFDNETAGTQGEGLHSTRANMWHQSYFTNLHDTATVEAAIEEGEAAKKRISGLVENAAKEAVELNLA